MKFRVICTLINNSQRNCNKETSDTVPGFSEASAHESSVLKLIPDNQPHATIELVFLFKELIFLTKLTFVLVLFSVELCNDGSACNCYYRFPLFHHLLSLGRCHMSLNFKYTVDNFLQSHMHVCNIADKLDPSSKHV